MQFLFQVDGQHTNDCSSSHTFCRHCSQNIRDGFGINVGGTRTVIFNVCEYMTQNIEWDVVNSDRTVWTRMRSDITDKLG